MKTKNLKQSNIRQFLGRRAFVLSALVSSLMLVQHTSYALQALEESDLRKIDGQDGMALQTEYAQIELDQLYWEDQAGTASNTEQSLRAVANDVKIQKNPN